MDRRIGRKLGERYSHVNGVLDTGLTIHKKKSLSNTEYIRRREEQFYRITRGQLGDLLEEYEAPDYESIRDTGNNGSPEGPKMASYRDDDEPVYNRPYLVLDVREAHEYQVNHICCAKSSPMTHLRRDLIPTDLNKFRNREGMLVIVYCDDERLSRNYADILTQRGTENVYLLTGGLRAFAGAFPEQVEGRLPEGTQTSAPPRPRGSRPRLTREALEAIPESSNARMGGAGSSRRGPVGSSPSRSPSKLTLRRPALNKRPPGGSSDAGKSTGSSRSVADSVISRAASRRGRVAR